jgi:hypothetical protein
MIFYALTDARLAGNELGQVVEFFVSREEAEAALRDVLADEPTWLEEIGVSSIEFETSAN